MPFIIYLLFTKVFCKWRLSTTIAYHNVRRHTLSEIHMSRKFLGNFYFWILLPGREIYFLGLLLRPRVINLVTFHDCIILVTTTLWQAW
jgi:hypothetical protein